jgi:signal transduction histidine kinase
MNKKNKLKIALLVLIILMVGTFYLVFKNFMYGNVNFFEKYELNKEVSFAQKNLQREAYHLYEKTAEWGNWDDTYSFISNKNSHYIENNLAGTPIFKQGEYLIIFLNNDGKMIYGLKYDDKTKQRTTVTKDIETLITTQKNTPGQKGILIIDNKIFIVAIHPVQTSKGTGPVKGMVLMARQMDPLLLDSQHADKLSFNFEILKKANKVAIADGALKKLNNNKISESVVLSDIYGRPALKLEVILDRYMMSYTQKTLWYLILSLCFISALFAFAIFYLIKKIATMEKQIFEAGKLAALGALGASISHELNNPLTIVHGYAENISEIMEDEGITNKKFSVSLDKIREQTNRMMTIIKYIKEFTSYAEGEPSDPVNLNLLVKKTIDEFNNQFDSHGIKLKIKQDKQLPPMFINPTKMSTVIHNLLTNARDAVDEKKVGDDKNIEVIAEVEATDQDRFIVLKVKDNGIGIPKKNLSKIFEPYFTTKDVAKGSGLGLSLVQGVVREYNGKIDVESSNEGTTFSIKFPINPLLNEHRNA